MMYSEPSVCFATMAVGDEYRRLATLLLDDIRRHCPDTKTFVVTDDQAFTLGASAVTTVSFRHTGYWYVYYGKLQAVRAALENHDICIFVDADSRLLERPPLDLLRALSPGAYGAYAQQFPYKFAGDHRMFVNRGGKERWLRNSPQRQLRLYSALGKSIGVDTADCVFLHEACLVFVRNESTPALLSAWEFLGNAASSRLLEWGEGCTLGMALRLLRLNAGVVPQLQEWLFKDLLLTPEAKYRPEIAQLLEQRRSFASPGRPQISSKAHRLFAGMLRYLTAAPLWLLRTERAERVRMLDEVHKT